MVLTVYIVLSPVSEFVLSPSSADFRFCRPGRADFTSANLTPATGARTTRLCRPQLSSFVNVPLIAHEVQLALRSHCAPDAAASTASRPASVTIAIRPFMGRDGGGYRSDLGLAGTEIFLRMGLDRVFNKLPDGQISEWCCLRIT